MNIRRFLVALALVVACGPSPDPAPSSDALQFEGTVRFVEVEGGCWALDAADGTRYQPTDLAEEFQREDLRVRVSAVPRDDVMGLCQVGPIIEVTDIEAIETGTE